MSGLDKATFKTMVEQIVEGFEAEEFKASLASASAAGDPMAIATLAMGVQSRVFATHGLDVATGSAAFKAAGRQFAMEPDIGPLLARMKAALG